MKPREQGSWWTDLLVLVGSIGLLAGALDPMEGSILILCGSGLITLGTFLGGGERGLLRYRAGVFGLLVFGVGALWGLSSLGGIGGKSGLSGWWGLLLLPYLVGWPMALGGPGHPRWFSGLGILLGLWYLFLLGMVLRHPGRSSSPAVAVVLAAVALATLAACAARLLRPKRS